MGNFIVNQVVKNGTSIIVTLAEREKPIKYDMSSHIVTSYTGRSILKFPIGTFSPAENLSKKEILLLDAVKRANTFQCDALKRLELFIGHDDIVELIVNNLGSYCTPTLPNSCPKGFINWLKEKNIAPSQDSLRTFKEEQILKTLSTAEKETLEFVKEKLSEVLSVSRYLEWNKEKRAIFGKVLKVSLKEFSLYLGHDLSRFADWLDCRSCYSMARSCSITPTWEYVSKTIDTNRSFKYNSKLLADNIDDEYGKVIIENENKIRELENYEDDNFVIVVPKKLSDFTDEGRQQNNCVGYYYHSSIEKGLNLIFFVRKKDNPEKSYMTCRYYVPTHSIDECRYKNNHTVYGEDIDFVYKIGERITEILNSNN